MMTLNKLVVFAQKVFSDYCMRIILELLCYKTAKNLRVFFEVHNIYFVCKPERIKLNKNNTLIKTNKYDKLKKILAQYIFTVNLIEILQIEFGLVKKSRVIIEMSFKVSI